MAPYRVGSHEYDGIDDYIDDKGRGAIFFTRVSSFARH
jgi:hypothetical protein